jgi:hypothetical protein
MENAVISNYAELTSRINYLKSERIRQEEELKSTFSEISASINLFSLINGSLNKRTEKKSVFFNLIKVGLTMGSTFIMDKILGKRRSFKGLLSSLLMEGFTALLINLDVLKIISAVNGFMSQKAGKQEL